MTVARKSYRHTVSPLYIRADVLTVTGTHEAVELNARQFLRLCRSDRWRILKSEQTPGGWRVKAVRLPQVAKP
jgi:hypothetical protein